MPENHLLCIEAYQKAKDYYLKYGACSQCVVMAVFQVLNHKNDKLIQAAHFLAGGGCLTGKGTCGALAAGQLVLSEFMGRTHEQVDKGKFKDSFKAGKELTEQFIDKYQGISCDDLKQNFTGQYFDMWGSVDISTVKAKMKPLCAELTGQVAASVVKILLENGFVPQMS